MAATSQPHVVIIGAGFCGLAAAYELGKQGIRATVLERDAEIGGLAGSFQVNGVRLEKFYHHWFTNDEHVMQLIKEVGKQDQILRVLSARLHESAPPARYRGSPVLGYPEAPRCYRHTPQP